MDAFICQIDRHNRVMYMLQDANLNVVGLVAGASTADPNEHGWPAAGTLLEQYVYEPYGKVVRSDVFHDHPVNRVGHQGLFFERYDGDFTYQTLAENANGLYYNRNRFYHPGLGRFTTRDPNETGMPILMALAMNGTSIDVFFGGFNGQSLYVDGMNLYLYQGSNPVTGGDSLGLYDDYEDAIADHDGWRVAAIGYINEGSAWTIWSLTSLADKYESILGIDFDTATRVLQNRGSAGDLLQMGLAIGAVAIPYGKAASGAWRTISHARSASWKAVGWSRRMAEYGRRSNAHTPSISSNAHNIIGVFPLKLSVGKKASLFDQKEWITKRIWDLEKELGRSTDAIAEIRRRIIWTIEEAGLFPIPKKLMDHLDHLLKCMR